MDGLRWTDGWTEMDRQRGGQTDGLRWTDREVDRWMD